MALVTRLTRLFRADMHAVLDRLEEPELVLKQAIREMAAEVQHQADRLKACKLALAQTDERIAALEKEIAGSQEALELCFDAEDDKLARATMRRQLQSQKLLEHLHQQHGKQDKAVIEAEAVLNEWRERLESMRQKAEVLSSNPEPRDDDPWQAWQNAKVQVSDADVDLALLREKQKRGQS